jgi:hypothetical protein
MDERDIIRNMVAQMEDSDAAGIAMHPDSPLFMCGNTVEEVRGYLRKALQNDGVSEDVPMILLENDGHLREQLRAELDEMLIDPRFEAHSLSLRMLVANLGEK